MKPSVILQKCLRAVSILLAIYFSISKVCLQSNQFFAHKDLFEIGQGITELLIALLLQANSHIFLTFVYFLKFDKRHCMKPLPFNICTKQHAEILRMLVEGKAMQRLTAELFVV